MRTLPAFVLLGLLAGGVSAQDPPQDLSGGAGAAAEAVTELRVLRAWFALEDADARAECEQLFRDAIADATLAEEFRIRAEIGLGRIDELEGRPAEARKRLEALIPRTADRPKLRRILLHRLGPPRWFSVVRVIPVGWFLDLDSGGMTNSRDRGPNGGPEMEGSGFLVPTAEDESIADAVPRMSAKPWRRLRTDEGNLCLVQVLATQPQPVVRFVTRLGGFGETLPAPQRPFCIGYNSKIEVWWRRDPRYVRYGVQRRLGPTEAWERAREFEKPPFIDRKVDAGRRYGYRIVGITPEGYEGLPVMLQGTVRSRGVTRGRIEVQQGQQIRLDLLRGEATARGWDILFANVWQQGAMIQNFYGSNIFALERGPEGADPLSPWDVAMSSQWQLKSGDQFIVPLYGGGVARCEIQIAQLKNNTWGATLDYEAFGDADVFPDPPRITARETEKGIAIHAEAEEPFRLSEVVVKELISGNGPWTIELDADGNGLDENTNTDEVREYSAVGVDPHGRRTLAGRTTVVRMPDKPVAGEFKFHMQQGFSFERRGLAPMGDADLFFQQTNANLDRLFFQAPFGVMNLNAGVNWQANNVDDVQIFDRVAGLEADNPQLPITQIWANKATPGESVLVLRTRHGGWVKVVIVDRGGNAGNWNQRLVTMRYVYNPRAPRFEEAPEEISVRGGVRFSGIQNIEARARIVTDWTTSWNALWRDGGFRRQMGDIAPAGGGVDDADEAQEVLLEQNSHKDLLKARFSFSLARRDPVEGNLLASVWDIRWQTEHFYGRVSGDDKSTLTDLGRTYWTRVKQPAHVVPWTEAAARVRMGHLYLHRKRVKNMPAVPTLFRVVGLEPWRRLQIEWVSLQDGRLKTSPGLALDEATQTRLRELLAGLPNDAEATMKAMGGEQALRTYAKLNAERVASVARRDARLADFVEELGLVAGLKFVLEGDVGTRKISVLRNGTTAFSLVMDVADAADLDWRIDAEGRIHMRPRVLSGAEEQEEAASEVRRAAARGAERKRQEVAEREERLAGLADVREALRAAIAELEQRKAAVTEEKDLGER